MVDVKTQVAREESDPRESFHLMAFQVPSKKSYSSYRRLRRQQHNLQPFDVYQINAYGNKVEK